MENPLDSRHVAACSPLSYASEVATRGLYETTQKLRDTQIRIAPLVAHGSMLRALTSDPTKCGLLPVHIFGVFSCHRATKSWRCCKVPQKSEKDPLQGN